MFGFTKKRASRASRMVLIIDGMHCSACSMNIDGELEELPGVISSFTSYAKQETTLEYDSSKVSKHQIVAAIEKLEYSVKKVSIM